MPFPLPPVTLLCGFLGAGKTTLLQHLLGQAEGESWALLVNDLASLNIDARLIETASSEVIELGNGCICCALKEDLAEALCRTAAQGRHSRLLVETTGAAEPASLAKLFSRKNPFGRSVSDFSTLEAIVTVVDAADFHARCCAGPGARHRAEGPLDLAELLLEQAECADVIVLNKCDLADAASLDRVEDTLRSLNPRAALLRAEQGQVPRELLLGRQRFDPAATPAAALWIAELNRLAPGAARQRAAPVAVRSSPDHTLKYGLRSFVFQARRPFSQAAFEALLHQGLPGIVRAKGFLWLAERPDEMAFLSLSPSTRRIDWLTPWWATLIETGRARLDERPPLVRALWREPHGDRRQELVFIGTHHDEPALRRSLESCLA
jgi:G3E family GTPase